MCITLYSDRVFCFERMIELDAIIDNATTDENLGLMISNNIRNRQAFNELKSYNDTGKFIYEHPLLVKRKQLNDLEILYDSNSSAFLDEQTKAKQTITRYKSRIKNNKYSNEEEKENWLNLIDYYQNKISLMVSILQSKSKPK